MSRVSPWHFCCQITVYSGARRRPLWLTCLWNRRVGGSAILWAGRNAFAGASVQDPFTPLCASHPFLSKNTSSVWGSVPCCLSVCTAFYGTYLPPFRTLTDLHSLGSMLCSYSSRVMSRTLCPLSPRLQTRPSQRGFDPFYPPFPFSLHFFSSHPQSSPPLRRADLTADSTSTGPTLPSPALANIHSA